MEENTGDYFHRPGVEEFSVGFTAAANTKKKEKKTKTQSLDCMKMKHTIKSFHPHPTIKVSLKRQ